MTTYQELANTIIINKKSQLIDYGDSLELAGTGRSAFVFRIKSTQKAIKVFFPEFEYIAKEEADIYITLQDISYFPTIYAAGTNYIVMDYIDGLTFFECMTQGREITSAHIKEVDYALSLASKLGLNPSDIHLRNIFITSKDEITIIDVARFRQTKDCKQWSHLKQAYQQLYRKRFFSKKIPATFLNIVAFLYKKGLIPSYQS